MSYGDKAGSGGPRVLGAKSWWVGRGSHHALHNFFSLPPAWLKLFKLSTFTFLRQINSYFTSSLSSIIKIQSITINVMKIQRECTSCETRQIMKWWVLQQGMEELIIEGNFKFTLLSSYTYGLILLLVLHLIDEYIQRASLTCRSIEVMSRPLRELSSIIHFPEGKYISSVSWNRNLLVLYNLNIVEDGSNFANILFLQIVLPLLSVKKIINLL